MASLDMGEGLKIVMTIIKGFEGLLGTIINKGFLIILGPNPSKTMFFAVFQNKIKSNMNECYSFLSKG